MGKPRKVPTARHGTGSRWGARWRDAGGKQRMRSFDRKLDAENFLTGLRADLMRGSYIDLLAQGKVTLRSYVEQRWLPSQVHLRPNSASLYASHVANHVVPDGLATGHSAHCAVRTARRSLTRSWLSRSPRPRCTPSTPCCAR